MDVPRHMNHHDRAKRLPLITQSATVTLVEAMDRSRNDEVLDAIRRELRRADHSGLLAAEREGADVDWEGLFARLQSAGVSDRRMDRIETLADRFERPYPSLLRMRVRTEEPLSFSPGQYVTLRAHDTPRAYSLANAPGDDELEFCIRRVPGGRLTGTLFPRVDEGDELVVRGPNGHMVLDDPSGRDVVFLATGTGVAPFKSMIDYLFEQGWDTHDGDERNVWLFLGCGWEDDLPYRSAFRERAREYDHFHFVPSLTRESLLTDWAGESDYVQRVLVKYLDDDALAGVELPDALERHRGADPAVETDARIDPGNVDVYACGITAMVETLVRATRAVGVPDKHLQYEGFG